MKKNILLVNPWIYDFKAYDFWLKPLGLLYLASYLRNQGFNVFLLDCLDRHHPLLLKKAPQLSKTDAFGRGKFFSTFIEKPTVYKNIPRRYKSYGIPKEMFLEILETIPEPDYILVTSVMTYWYLGTFSAIKILKERFKKKPLILGGIYPTFYYRHASQFSSADIVIRGRGEIELIKYIEGLKPMPLFELPYPAFDLYSHLDYTCILTSLGCPFRCPYCAVSLLVPDYSYRAVDSILKEIEFYKSLGVKNIAFYDDALLYNPNFKSLLKEIIKQKLDLNFHTPNGLHPRYIDEEIAELLFKANFKSIYLSLETTDPALQREFGSKVFTEEFLRGYRFLTKAGFNPNAIGVYLMIGLPYQETATIKKSIEFLLELKVKIHLAEFSPIPFTKEWERLGLPDDEPLLTNNTIFPAVNKEKREELWSLKSWLNTERHSIPSLGRVNKL